MSAVGSPVDLGLGPTAEDVAHLLRFMCQTWVQVDAWSRVHCTDMDAIGSYPVIQGTGNQIRLGRIGAQPFDQKRLQAGMQWMLGPNVGNACEHCDHAGHAAAVAEERERWVKAATAALDVLDDLPAWSNAGHACQLLREALGPSS